MKMYRANYGLVLLFLITLISVTKAEAKVGYVSFEDQKADTSIEYPEWYLNPPENYTQNGATHFFAPSQGMSVERALANAIINLGLELKRLDPTNRGPVSYDNAFASSGKTSTVINRTIDSIKVFGIESFEWEETSDNYTNTFLRNFKISYESGKDFYSIDFEEKEVTAGKDTDYNVTFDVEEKNYGFRGFLEHLDNSKILFIKEKATVNNECFLLLEFVQGDK